MLRGSMWVVAACLVIAACGNERSGALPSDAVIDTTPDVLDDAAKGDVDEDAAEDTRDVTPPDVPSQDADAATEDADAATEDVDAATEDADTAAEDADTSVEDADSWTEDADPGPDAVPDDADVPSVDVPTDVPNACTSDAECAAALSPGPCQIAACDTDTGACALLPAEAGTPCDDGDLCTTGDACDGAGACAGDAVDCDDEDVCTVDACDPATGECTHQADPCDDGNPCTTDSCEPGVGCAHAWDVLEAACVEDGNCMDGVDNDGDGLTDCADDECAGVTGCCKSDADCASDDVCSTSACNVITKQCESAPVDCNDGDLCTDDRCEAGVGCVADPILPCGQTLPYATAFDCGEATDWTAEVVSGQVTWAVDALPDPPAFYSTGCSLNFNDDLGGYDSGDEASTAHVTSPVIDATGFGTLYLGLWQYWDTEDEPDSAWDKRWIQISTDGFATWKNVSPKHNYAANYGEWFYSVFDLGAFAGEALQIRFWFDSVDGSFNQGAGWFIDDLSLTPHQPAPTPEVCDNGQDDDGDSLIDCEDPGCILDPACPESALCDDGLDNDSDGLIDCADPDCGTAEGCCLTDADCDDGNACTADVCTQGVCVSGPPTCSDGDPCTVDGCDPVAGCQNVPYEGCSFIYANAFECGDTDFTTQVLSGAVAWKVDALPGPPAFYSPGCSLNFNKDGGGYGSPGVASHAIATSPVIDLTGVDVAWLGFWQYWKTGDGPTSGWDKRGVRVSTDGFQTFVELPQSHATGNEAQWFHTALDLSPFAGQEIQIRFWFDSVDSVSNGGAGWFVDDLVVSVEQPSAVPEVCDDGVDNDADGLTDCVDPACEGAPGCCSADGDCTDGDACTTDTCASDGKCAYAEVTCQADGDTCTAEVCDSAIGCFSDPIGSCEILYETPFACDESGWTAEITDGLIPWAVDGLPSPPGYSSPECSLNFNDDVGGYASPGFTASAAHVTSPVIDATGVAEVWLGFVQYWHTSDSPTSGYDERGIRVSTDGFATWTDIAPKHAMANKGLWFHSTFDLSAFAGTEFQVRFWFDTVDDYGNTGRGWFVDDLQIATVPPESTL